ncbi:hypothetical protein Pan258_29800 [Symmachiella dynata]|nr:hypothetical protein Pan258_29800 [Symmachiella dynata]
MPQLRVSCKQVALFSHGDIAKPRNIPEDVEVLLLRIISNSLLKLLNTHRNRWPVQHGMAIRANRS